MENLEKFRKDEARRLISWIRENRNEWQDILNAITEQDGAVSEEIRTVIKCLRDNGFYSFIVLLLYADNVKIQSMIENVLLSSADIYWSETLPGRVIDRLLENLVDDRK